MKVLYEMMNLKYFLQYFDHKSSMQLTAFKPFLNYGRFFIQKERRVIPHFIMPNLQARAVRALPQQQTPYYPQDFPLREREIIQRADLQEEKPQTSEPRQNTPDEKGTLNNIQQISYEANAPTEDRIVVAELKQIDGYMVSIFDGHGGSMFSDYAAHKITDLMEEFLFRNFQKYSSEEQKRQVICDGLKWAYDMMEENFYEDIYLQQLALQNKSVKNVGTCGLTIIVSGGEIYMANCGDSQAIVVKNQFDNLEYVKLNERLSAANPHERERLTKEFPNDPDILLQADKGNYYIKGRLQPTRTLGDYHMKKKQCWQFWRGKGEFHGPYVSHTPDIRVFPIKKQYKSIVIGSDGLWDYIDPWAVSRISLEQHATERILQETMKNIANKRKKTLEDVLALEPGEKRKCHDDISIVIVDISPQFSHQ